MKQWEGLEVDEKRQIELKNRVRPILEEGRPGDWEHTLRTIRYAWDLLRAEPGDPEIVISTLYLHDIGWSRVDLDDFFNASPRMKRYTGSCFRHMEEGALLARKILDDLHYDKILSDKIVSIISVHDAPETVFSMHDPSATLVVEADRMDRYGLESLVRFNRMFGAEFLTGDHKSESRSNLLEGLDLWFKTPTGRSMAKRLAMEGGLIE
ncbi:MAG: HD domain-containing protein [Deltaproteobacteria bacterium]|nr:HD domain-containing protein [Deltaproteobacteria bacterium]